MEQEPQIENKNIVAFAGIGRPQKFYDSLKKCGLNIVKTFDFPDHHLYKNDDIKKIVETAEDLGAEIFTTSKDFVKIPYIYKSKINELKIGIKWKNENKLIDFLSK